MEDRLVTSGGATELESRGTELESLTACIMEYLMCLCANSRCKTRDSPGSGAGAEEAWWKNPSTQLDPPTLSALRAGPIRAQRQSSPSVVDEVVLGLQACQPHVYSRSRLAGATKSRKGLERLDLVPWTAA